MQKEEIVTESVAEARKWKNRRRMTWLTLLCIIAETYALLFSEAITIERLKALEPVIAWSYAVAGGVISSYFGFATWDGIKKNGTT